MILWCLPWCAPSQCIRPGLNLSRPWWPRRAQPVCRAQPGAGQGRGREGATPGIRHLPGDEAGLGHVPEPLGPMTGQGRAVRSWRRTLLWLVAPEGWCGVSVGGAPGAGRAGGALRAPTLPQAYPHCIWEGDLSHSTWLLLRAKPAVMASGAAGWSNISQRGAGVVWIRGGYRLCCLTVVIVYFSATLVQFPECGWDGLYIFLWTSATIYLCS